MTTHAALRILREEHAAMAAILSSARTLLAEHRRLGTLPEFEALRAMLFYLDEFPEQRHHRKETDLLFPLLRARTPELREELLQLDDDHAHGEYKVRELEHALLAFEMMGEPRRAAFEEAFGRYADFYLGHMAMEEKNILPLAARVLSEADWRELDEAFEGHRDPLTGHEPDAEYRTLFTRIVNLVPSPIGLGPPLERAHKEARHA